MKKNIQSKNIIFKKKLSGINKGTMIKIEEKKFMIENIEYFFIRNYNHMMKNSLILAVMY